MSSLPLLSNDRMTPGLTQLPWTRAVYVHDIDQLPAQSDAIRILVADIRLKRRVCGYKYACLLWNRYVKQGSAEASAPLRTHQRKVALTDHDAAETKLKVR